MNDIYPQVANNNIQPVDPAEAQETAVIMPRQWMVEQRTSSQSHLAINANQRASLMAMIAYIAFKSGHSEFRIERSLADRFNVANAKFLRSDDFDDAIRYLADILST